MPPGRVPAATAALLLLGLGGAGARSVADGDEAAGHAAGHARMVALLAEAARATPWGYPLDTDLERGRAELAAIPPGAHEQRALRLALFSEQQMRLGRIEESIRTLEEARDTARRLPEWARPPGAEALGFWLGVAHLRLAETENCVKLHTGEACILPIREGGVHARKEASRAAVPCFAEVVRGTPPGAPLHVAAKWLVNIAFMTLGEYPEGVPADLRIDPAVFAAKADFPRFENVAQKAGLDTLSLAGGAVVEDFDGDGFLDVLVSSFDLATPLRLFRNGGDGSFTPRTAEAGLEGIGGGLNMVQADYDNDGDVDVLVLRGAWLGAEGRHANSLLRNDGHGTFTDVTFAAGLGEVHYPTQTAAWADYDLDGHLDLYVGNEVSQTEPYPSQLFRSNRDGTFTDVARAAGVENLRWAKGVAWGDYDGDGWPDLYVSNLHGDNRLYRNRGDGTFTDVAPALGVAGPKSSFAAWFWDYDNDGVLDILVNSYLRPLRRGAPPDVWYVAASRLGLPHPAEAPALYRGDGKGGFVDVAAETGLHHSTLPMGANFGDLDGDGWLDFYLGTGYPGLEGLVPNVMYRNDRGRRFVDVTFAGGFGHLQKGHGVAFADLDNDGDQDVFAQMGGFYPPDSFADALFENPGFGHRWITLELVGTRSNRSAIGTRIRVEIEEEGRVRSLYRRVGSGGSFGADPLREEIGLGRAGRIRKLEVHWPASRTTQTFRDVGVDRFARVVEGKDEIQRLPGRPARTRAR